MEIIILANSRKLNGRCIAGINLETGNWIRPVGRGEHGAVTLAERRIDGREPELLHIVDVPLGNPIPLPYQRENIRALSAPWRFVRLAAEADIRRLIECYDRGPDLLGNQSDRLPIAIFDPRAPAKSLALIKPEQPRFCVVAFEERRKNRLRFVFAGTRYDLAVTDPVIEKAMSRLEIGAHRPRQLGFPDEVSLTVSVGEPFEGNCYKLVAAVLAL